MNFQAALNLLAAGHKVMRAPWNASGTAYPYLTQVSRPLFELRTVTAGYGSSPPRTSTPAPYTPAQNDMTASDWCVADPATRTLTSLVAGTGLFHDAIRALGLGTPAVSRSGWNVAGSMPYVTLAAKTQIEIQTKIRNPGSPPTYYTTVPSPYTASQDDLAALDWGEAYPEAFQ